jgi:hypothetical protein
MKTQNEPKTWDELKAAGDVIELTEEQVAIARDLFNPRPVLKPRTPEQDSEVLHANEARMRGLK